jgi:nucleotide-binding universal stress UspA family protein
VSKPILAGYDPRLGDRAPVDFGVAVARLTGAPLLVAAVHARASVLAVSAGQSLAYGVVDDDLLDEAPEALRALEGEMRSLGVDAEVRAWRGASAASALHALGEEADAGLLVVGSDRRANPGRVRAGSTAGRLLHGSPCPVALVPREWTAHPVETVGVAFVDSEEGRQALRGAHAIARRVGARLRAITVVKPRLADASEAEATTPARDRRDPEDVVGEHRLAAESALRRAVDELGADVTVEVEALIGDPVQLLVTASEQLDLLVCGSRGYGPLRAVLLGSVSGAVMMAARCAVIAVPRGVRTSLDDLAGQASRRRDARGVVASS